MNYELSVGGYGSQACRTSALIFNIYQIGRPGAKIIQKAGVRRPFSQTIALINCAGVTSKAGILFHAPVPNIISEETDLHNQSSDRIR